MEYIKSILQPKSTEEVENSIEDSYIFRIVNLVRREDINEISPREAANLINYNIRFFYIEKLSNKDHYIQKLFLRIVQDWWDRNYIFMDWTDSTDEDFWEVINSII